MSSEFQYDVDTAAAHLADHDAVMRKLVEQFGVLDPEARRRHRPADAYGALLRAIVGQQLSVKAAASIFERLKGLFDGKVPLPQDIQEADPEHLRSAGMSRPKITYLKDLAEHVLDGRLELQKFPEMSDEDVAAELTAVKGLGQWTADMFLIFYLGRPDILPVGDLGIRNAARVLYDLPDPVGPTDLERVAEPWRPYRSLGSLYLWQSLDNEPT